MGRVSLGGGGTTHTFNQDSPQFITLTELYVPFYSSIIFHLIISSFTTRTRC